MTLTHLGLYTQLCIRVTDENFFKCRIQSESQGPRAPDPGSSLVYYLIYKGLGLSGFLREKDPPAPGPVAAVLCPILAHSLKSPTTPHPKIPPLFCL